MQEELQALEARNQSLQQLVGELLRTNHSLRLQLANQTEAAVKALSAPATHPPQLQDR